MKALTSDSDRSHTMFFVFEFFFSMSTTFGLVLFL
jgi:hypothetical protein